MKVMKIKSSHPESQGDYVLINEEDFDPSQHGVFDEAAGSAGNGLAGLTVAELKALAAERGIDLEDATKKADIIAAIQLAGE